MSEEAEKTLQAPDSNIGARDMIGMLNSAYTVRKGVGNIRPQIHVARKRSVVKSRNSWTVSRRWHQELVRQGRLLAKSGANTNDLVPVLVPLSFLKNTISPMKAKKPRDGEDTLVAPPGDQSQISRASVIQALSVEAIQTDSKDTHDSNTKSRNQETASQPSFHGLVEESGQPVDPTSAAFQWFDAGGNEQIDISVKSAFKDDFHRLVAFVHVFNLQGTFRLYDFSALIDTGAEINLICKSAAYWFVKHAHCTLEEATHVCKGFGGGEVKLSNVIRLAIPIGGKTYRIAFAIVDDAKMPHKAPMVLNCYTAMKTKLLVLGCGQ